MGGDFWDFCKIMARNGVYFSTLNVYNYLDKVKSLNCDLEQRNEKKDPLPHP